jgi:prenyltransferase beta subunit
LLVNQDPEEVGIRLIGESSCVCVDERKVLYVSRKKMYAWFMSLKQPDGSFLVSVDGEVDVRGVYCLLCVASLLNMLTPELIEGTASFVASCQTYEGGFASASQPFYGVDGKLLSSPRPPLGEAHGGYTFCATAAWVMLRPFTRLIPSKERPSINARSLKRWLTQMQGQSSEIGGFRGRTNKLVDGCYAWWVGGCFGLLESLDVSDVSQKAATQGKCNGACTYDYAQDAYDNSRLATIRSHGSTGVRDHRRSAPEWRSP